MLELSLADSWARLEWVKVLIARIEPAVQQINLQGKRGNLVLAVGECADHEHARVTLSRPLDVADELGFIVADIAVNARSCLDMAIQALVDAYGLSIRDPMFPIEDNLARNGLRPRSRAKTLFDVLQPEFREVLIDLQPTYERPGLGRMDIPINEIALMIRAISNANKHRNITPTVRTATSMGFANIEGVPMEFVYEQDESPWPAEDNTLLEVRYAKGAATNEQLRTLRPITSLQLMIHKTGFRYDSFNTELPVSTADFLSRVPKYIKYALTIIEQAHRQVQDPQPEFRRDWNIAL